MLKMPRRMQVGQETKLSVNEGKAGKVTKAENEGVG
jgi:hypothetical protein